MIKKILTVLILSLCFASDSIPTWQIVYSRIYHKQFVKENTEYDLQLLQQENAEFHNLVTQYFDTALDLIPVFSGINWKKNYNINIYPSRTKESFSHPLTISHNKNQYFMFYTLIHEAVHHNLNIEFPSSVMDEAFCDKVAMKVAKYIDPVIYRHRIYSSYFGLQKFYKWDLDSLSIKEWWERNELKVEASSNELKAFESELYHKNEDKILDRFNKIKNSDIKEYREQSFRKLIDYYERENDLEHAIAYSKAYLRDISDGAFTSLIRFKLVHFYLRKNDKSAAMQLLAQLKNSSGEINNYLDDLYVLMGKLASGQKSLIDAAGHFLYVIETLPNGHAKADAYRNLGRIYLRLDQAELAGKIYNLAFENMQRNDERAQLLIEMKIVNGSLDLVPYKAKLIDTIRRPLKQELLKQLEGIYKDLLN